MAKVLVPKNAVPVYASTGKTRPIVGYKIGNQTYDAKMNPTNDAAKAAVASAAYAKAHITPSSGGGGGGGKGGPIAAISDAVSSVGNAVTSAVTAVGNTVDAIIQNPLPMIETVALIYVGVPPAVASAAVSAMNGGNISDVATAAVTAYAGGQIASAVGGSAGSTIAAATEPTAGAYLPSATTSTLVKVASSAVGADVAATTIALSQGKDLTTALDVGTKAAVSSVISSAASEVGSTVASKVDDATAAQILANAAAGGTTAALTGKDIATGAATAGTLSAAEQGIKSALDTGADALKSITKPTPAPTPTAEPPVTQVAATPSGVPSAEDFAKLIGAAQPPTASLDTGVVSDAGSAPPIDATVNIPPSQVAGLDITQDQSAAETARLAAKNAELAAATTTSAPVTRDQQILDLIATPSNVEPTATTAPTPTPSVVEPKQGAYLPEATPEPVPAPAPSPDQAILDLINQPAVEPTPAPTPVPTPVSEVIQPAPVAESYSGSMPDESAAETERLARLNQQATAPAAVEPTQGAYLPESTIDQQILDLIAEKPATTDVAAVGDEPATPDKTPVTAPPVEAPVTTVEPPVEVDPNIPRVEVPGVVNVEPTQGAYLPDTVPAETTPIEPAPVAEGYSTSMPDESAAETARLAAKEQQILDLITPAPVATEPKQGAYLPNAAPAPEAPDIPAADPMSQDPAQKAAALIDAPPVSDSDKQILDLISEAPTEDQSDAETERLARKEAELAGAEKGAYLPDSGTDTKTTTYKPNIFTTTYLSPKTRTAAAPTSALGSALGTTGLTSYRGAGEIEGTGSGKPRKKVWNEESLKLKDALGV
jgi:hypothetical protein